MAFVKLEQLLNLHDGYRHQFVVDRRELLLIQEHGQLYLLQSSCPHLHWPLISGHVQGDIIHCPKHGMAFNLITGQPANERALSCNPLRIYQPVYEGNFVGLWLEESD